MLCFTILFYLLNTVLYYTYNILLYSTKRRGKTLRLGITPRSQECSCGDVGRVERKTLEALRMYLSLLLSEVNRSVGLVRVDGFYRYHERYRGSRAGPSLFLNAAVRKVRILRLLQHSNVVGIYQFFKDDPRYYFSVLEHMEGGELFDRIVQKTLYNEEEARNLCRVLVDSIRYCHELGIVHRNLKPENLMLSSKEDDTNIKLADFRFACSVLNGNVTDQYGSPGYVAPEILKALPYGTSVDMWSIGVIIYTLLGGYPPFHDENQTRLFRRIKAGSFKFHDEYWSDISSEAKDFIQRLLIVDVKKRMTATQAVDHPWLLRNGHELARNNLERNLEQLRIFNAIRKMRAAIKSVIAAKRMLASVGLHAH